MSLYRTWYERGVEMALGYLKREQGTAHICDLIFEMGGKWEEAKAEVERLREAIPGKGGSASRDRQARGQVGISTGKRQQLARLLKGAEVRAEKAEAKLSEVEAELELYRIDEQDIPPEAELQAKLNRQSGRGMSKRIPGMLVS